MPYAAPVATSAKPAPNMTQSQGLPKPAAVTPTQPPANGATDATKAPAQAESKYHLTVDGEEREMTRAEVQKLIGKHAFVDKTMHQVREEAKRLADERAKAAADDSIWEDEHKLEEHLTKKGKADLLDRLARKRLEAKVHESQLTPEQKQALAEKQRADAAEGELKKVRDAEAQKRNAEAVEVLCQRMSDDLAQAAERAGYGKDPDSFYALYEVVKDFKRLRLPWDAERIVEEASKNVDGAFARLEQKAATNLKGAALKQRLGPVVWKEVLRYAAEELRSGNFTKKPPPATQSQTQQPSPGYFSPSEIANKYRGGR